MSDIRVKLYKLKHTETLFFIEQEIVKLIRVSRIVGKISNKSGTIRTYSINALKHC